MPTPKSTVQSPSTRIKTRTDAINYEIETLQSQLAAKQAKLEFFTNLPEDDYANGAIVVFEKKFASGGIVYTYAAVKGGNFWYLSGDTNRRTWDGLLEHLYYNVSLDGGGFIRSYWVSEIQQIG